MVDRVSTRLPDFPWDQLTPYAEKARAHPAGIVDLSIGTPVDATPEIVQAALRAATDSPGYPATIGLPETRQACIDWLARRFGVLVRAWRAARKGATMHAGTEAEA